MVDGLPTQPIDFLRFRWSDALAAIEIVDPSLLRHVDIGMAMQLLATSDKLNFTLH